MNSKINIIIAASSTWIDEQCYLKNLAQNCCLNFITHKVQLTTKNIEKYQPTYIFFPHWSHIIPAEIHQNYECIIFHMTDLPYGRGGSPLQNLIVNKVKCTKISALRCVKELDAGPIYLKKDLSLHGTAEEIYQRAGLIIMEMIKEIISKNITPTPQKGNPTVFKRRKPEESNINHISDIDSIYDYIRMLDAKGYPQAFIESEYAKFEFESAKLSGDEILANVKIKIKEKH